MPVIRDRLAVVHAALLRLSGDRGQSTIEYVGLMLLMSVILAAVVKAGVKMGDGGLADTVINKVKGAIDGVGEPRKG